LQALNTINVLLQNIGIEVVVNNINIDFLMLNNKFLGKYNSETYNRKEDICA